MYKKYFLSVLKNDIKSYFGNVQTNFFSSTFNMSSLVINDELDAWLLLLKLYEPLFDFSTLLYVLLLLLVFGCRFSFFGLLL